MAESKINQSIKIPYVEVNIGGTNISTLDNGWYYSEDISVAIPNGARIIGVTYGNFSAGVFVIPRGNTLSLVSYKSTTLPANRKVYVYYTY